MKYTLTTILALITCFVVNAQTFDNHFEDATLRVDLTFAGSADEQFVALKELSSTPHWWGRRINLDTVPMRGNGDLTLRNAQGEVIYMTSFSSLFQEWITTPEAATSVRSFEFTLLCPMPREAATMEVTLRNNHGEVACTLRHNLNPDDVLIRDRADVEPLPHHYLHRGGDSRNCIDVVILAEGYTAEEMELFLKDAQTATDEILHYEPFNEHRDKFNFIAVESASKHSNVSVPQDEAWRVTAVKSNFMTFYMERYLTSDAVYSMYDIVTNIPCEHLIILANTDTYGGGGIYNSYTLTTAHHPAFKPVVVHEFGHSFGGLGDEYFYAGGDQNDEMHSLKHEPWEPNITTLVDFESKWADMVDKDVEIPTAVTAERSANYTVGVYEGGGYRSKGIYRPADVCRMRNNTADRFCPVCQRALERVILHQAE